MNLLSANQNSKSFPIIGVEIHATSYEDACDRILSLAQSKTSCYIVAANVHVVMTAFWDRTYREVVNRAILVTPDGMPLVWGLRLLGVRNQPRVYGPDLMLAWCDRAAKEGLSVYLYGSKTETLEKLERNLKVQFPQLAIAGSYAPPYQKDVEVLESELTLIKESGAAVVFVALGCPKQEFWMAQVQGKLDAVMVGVGAAFDFHSGQVSQAPRWIMRLGLEWLYRFAQEPQRLWRRYLLNNPLFVILFAWQLLRGKH
ncbi:WecB/TagA/CpsF family glycosyltransferase [Tumidithrix elongata RA019]|uniref:WecB/TagA/CpsF family glycosyltransferase n=1 Tax=Tumidithrix elongata BACA0141 TaxID=2716417 RepID=A0AAW9PSB0_9CYAN|nr:WecB/TagA/CpsF family glycosyltransferase [Tumidithrix elongata RA019]